MDVFLEKNYRPMLIGREAPAFDDDNYIYELKLDGIRCLAYFDGKTMSFVTRNDLEISSRFPELDSIQDRVAGMCVLDGELVVLSEGVPDFEKAKERALATNGAKIERMAHTAPATYVVFDILYFNDKELIRIPLIDRRMQLEKNIKENDHLALSRFVEGKGLDLFAATKERGLEGIIAKRKDSLYYPGKRSSDWVKCKNLLDDDFVIGGYINNKNSSISLVLGQYDENDLLKYCGHVVLNESERDYAQVLKLKEVTNSPFAEPLPPNNSGALWVELGLVCRVSFLSRTENGLMRHPVFKELRIDKAPEDTRFHFSGGKEQHKI